uniref:Uncharacterized protein n=1 Tax=Anguilla anguilla TaxID=7936 RepID=A0A0E9XRH8_ANGAN
MTSFFLYQASLQMTLPGSLSRQVHCNSSYYFYL